MKLGSSYLINGVLLGLVVASVAAACGSDDGKKRAQEVTAGAGGEGGAKPVSSGGSTVLPAGGGGQATEVSGGQGGVPAVVTAGEGGVPMVIEIGGAPAAGAGGAPPDELPPVVCDPPVFADSNLEDAVRTAIDKAGPLTAEDIAELTALDASGYQVANLGGIECFTEIADLDLGIGGGASQVSDLMPLRYLKKLETLDLSSNPLQTLEPLGKLPSLTTLRLSNSGDNLDLAPLATSPALVRVDLDSNIVGDLSPLAQIATLRELWFTNSSFTAPNTLSSLTKVERLYLSGTQLADATPLAALVNLTELDINGNANITNFDKLHTLTKLTRLSASNNTSITSITAVASMTQLTWLNLYFDQIVDVSPIQGLTQLHDLYLNFNPITDITPLANNAGLGAGDNVNLAGISVNCQAQAQIDAIAALKARQVNLNGPCN
jgi:internalin A